MQGRVLLLGGNFYPEPTGIGKFNGEMIDWLTAHDFRCTVITSYPYYPFWKVQRPYIQKAYSYHYEVKNLMSYYASPIEIYRCPQFVPQKPTGFKRILLDLSFTMSAFLVIINLLFKRRYDYIISVVPSFQLGLLGLFYRTFRGGKFFYHIQDLQIDAARDLRMIKSPVLLKVLFRVEKFILRHADVVSSISPGMISKVESKCKREVLLFPNWVDTKLFYPIKDKAALKREFNFKSTDTIVLYSGAIGEKQGLDIILHSARALRTVPHLKFIICGTGPYMKHLERMKEDLHLDNLTFRPLQPANLLNRFLNMADIHLVIQKKEASDLVMPSKLTNILAIGGVAIVTASADSSLFKIIEKKKIAYAIEPENRTALTQAISTCLELKNDSISINARLYAEQALSIDKVMFRFSGHMRPGIGANFGGLSVDA